MIMGTFLDFSDALYEFHSIKAGNNKGQYNSIESLCKVAKDFFEIELAKIDEQDSYIHIYTEKRQRKRKMYLQNGFA